MRRYLALKILDDNRKTYDEIAGDFSRTRADIWQEFDIFSEYIKDGDKILDLGCGNGRLINLFKYKKINYLGVDNSKKLLEFARLKYPNYEFLLFDGLKIPAKANQFDTVFCIAVFHHIPSKHLRLDFLEEIKRVLKPGGRVILTVWSFFAGWQIELNKREKLLINYTLIALIGKTFGRIFGLFKDAAQLDFGDIFMPWGSELFGSQDKCPERYIHFFTKFGLKRCFRKVGLYIEKSGFLKRGKDNYNLYIIARKNY